MAIDIFDCQPTDLIEPKGSKQFSALHLVFFLPLKLDIPLPRYVPEPSCNLSNDDIEYVLLSELPDWIEYDEDARRVTAETNDVKLLGETFDV